MIQIVYLDTRTNALELMLTGKKTMIAKGSMGRRIPYKRIEVGDTMYFLESKRNRDIDAKAKVLHVYYSGKLTEEESYELLDQYKTELRLNTSQYRKYAGKRYITLVNLSSVEKVTDRTLKDDSNINNEEWILIEHLEELVEE